jgi:hypothetical protein
MQIFLNLLWVTKVLTRTEDAMFRPILCRNLGESTNFTGGRSTTAKLTSVDPSPWFVISSSALDRHAVEGRDGFSIAVSPDILSSNTRIEAEAETQDREATALNTRHAICWEFMGASSPWNYVSRGSTIQSNLGTW